jgi:hypothetical protein
MWQATGPVEEEVTSSTDGMVQTEHAEEKAMSSAGGMGRMWMEYPVRYLPIDQEEVGLAATV